MNKIGHMQAVSIAKKLTKQASEVKDWRCRTVRDKECRNDARDLAAGKGYIISTMEDIHKKYPEHITVFAAMNDSHKYLWAFAKTIPDRNRRVGIRICAVHQF